MKRIILVFFLIPAICFGGNDSTLTFTEVMFNAPTGNNEFIEIYNLSSSESVDLTGYKIKYYTSSSDGIISLDTNLILPPNSYAVILEGDYDFANGVYNSLIPLSVLILKIDNGSFGSSGMANTTDRTIFLLNKLNDTVDVYSYSANNGTGYSDEKIILNSDNSVNNWKNSISQNGTPGFKNSISQKSYDLSVSSLSIFPPSPVLQDEIKVNVTVTNIGILSANNFTMEIFLDKNLDSLVTEDDIIYSEFHSNLQANDSAAFNTLLPALPANNYLLIAKVSFQLDEDTSNNIRFRRFVLHSPPNKFNDLIINEIMYSPSTGQPEWIELFNRTASSINLKKWKFYDNSSHTNVTLQDNFIPPNGYAVLCKDSLLRNHFNIPAEIILTKLPSLNNTGDITCIRDSAGITIDSLEYLPTWGGNAGGKSLERISSEGESILQENWGTSNSKFKATPGKINSLTKKNYDLGITGFKTKNGYGIINEPVALQIKIKNYGFNSSENFSIKIYNDLNSDSTIQANEFIAELLAGTVSAGDSLILTYTITNYSIGKNYFIVELISTNDEEGENNISFTSFVGVVLNEVRNDLVINEFMYAPTTPEPEWIEIYNRSNKTIELKNYQLADDNDTIKIVKTSTPLQPGKYFVITKDSSLFAFFDIPGKYVINSFPSLNNSTDKIILLDSLNRTIDSLEYSSPWGGQYGRSLERISIERSSTVKENWGTSKSPDKATPGKMNSITIKNYDLAINEFKSLESFGILGKSVRLRIVVKNIGMNSFNSFQLKIYKNENGDSLIKSSELLKIIQDNPLSPNDSLTFYFDVNSFLEGKNYFISNLSAANDDDTTNNISFTNFPGVKLNEERNDIVVNEIMYAPNSPEPEWLEIYNRSLKSIQLKNYKIADASDTMRVIKNSITLNPKEYFVIAKDSSFVGYYEINSKFLISSFPSLNNSSEKIILLDSLNRTIDSLEYHSSWGGSAGRSLERISTEQSSTITENWGTSKNPEKATPGTTNSITKKNFDLAITEFKPSAKFGILGNSVRLSIKVKNIGLNSFNSFLIKIYRDENLDSLMQTNELITSIQGAEIFSGDSLTFTFELTNFSEGENFFIAALNAASDEDTTNNISVIDFQGVKLNEVRNDIVINEIMYAPNSPEPEWVEIYNQSPKNVDLKNYQLADATDITRIARHNLLIAPNEFMVIAKDSSILQIYKNNFRLLISDIPTLNNTFDKIILLDSLDRTIDSLEYSSKWGGGNGHSLERINYLVASIDSSNWKTSITKLKATPGLINSVTKKDYDLELTQIYFDPPFPVKGDSIKISAKVKNIGKLLAQFHLLLFEDTKLDSTLGKLLETTTQINLSGNDSSTIQFNFIEQNLIMEKGFAVKIIFDSDQDTSNNFGFKRISPGYLPSSLIVNEIMFTPQGGEPEWVELYNASQDSVNLKDWSISDIYTTPVKSKITSQNIYLPPKKYLIISKDSSINFYHRYIPSKLIVMALPVLNNDEDGVVLRDSRNAAIDSVLYNKSWGGLNGFSLERKSSSLNSNTHSNWGSSKDLELSTPGRINSIAEKKFDLSFAGISSVPVFPVAGDEIFLKVKAANNGSGKAENFHIQFFFNSDSSTNYNFLTELSNLSLNPGDTSWFASNISIKNIQSKLFVKAVIIFPADEDSLNNTGIVAIQTGYAKNLLLINEVMYDPAIGEPEWFEMINVSPLTLNLKNWTVGDLSLSLNLPKISSTDLLLIPNEILVVAKDTSFKNYHKSFNGKFAAVNFGSLGNTDDGIIVYDFRGAVIDSLYYKSSWGNKQGFSLERISTNEATNDSTNWMISLNKDCSTPGKANSVIDLKSYQSKSVVINEIMFEPSTNNAEFIEFLNVSNDSINVGGWKANDFLVSDVSRNIASGEYFILASDSSILNNYNWLTKTNFSVINQSSLGLTNTEDIILVKDANGNTIDSVYYFAKWNNQNILVTTNKSLERINPLINGNEANNWSTAVCTDGATPGKQNSIFTQNQKLEEKISVSPNPFSPDNDGFEDFTIINYNLKQTTAQVRIKIFDSQGRLVRTLLNNQASGSQGSVIFDGLNDSGNPLRIGIYIIFLEALNENSGVLETMKTVVVVARKL
ncbi:MAG: lamin tail domain-containing protein [Ignavibacteriales bacterium]|nr:lamin tail domain-containing protein [Ignavibacteriales bacterium]